ncbi:phosphoribosylglycinamide formyltransferase [Candidatus Peregrinibacteria bacterium]|nr:phosphoribosylglycinamide formyltransferase [Candidatus Peregrinibacteria bacterium]
MTKAKDKLRIAILASTSGSDLPAIFAMDRNHYNFVFLLTNKEHAPCREKAENANVPDIFLDATGKSREEYDEEILQLLEKEKIDLVILVGWMRILSSKLVRAYLGRMINVHPSLLPAFPGGMDTNVHEEVLKAGIKKTGVTIHFVTENLDEGPIILQKSCSVDANETVDSLKAKVQKLEQEMFPEVIRMFRMGKIHMSDIIPS